MFKIKLVRNIRGTHRSNQQYEDNEYPDQTIFVRKPAAWQTKNKQTKRINNNLTAVLTNNRLDTSLHFSKLCLKIFYEQEKHYYYFHHWKVHVLLTISRWQNSRFPLCLLWCSRIRWPQVQKNLWQKSRKHSLLVCKKICLKRNLKCTKELSRVS